MIERLPATLWLATIPGSLRDERAEPFVTVSSRNATLEGSQPQGGWYPPPATHHVPQGTMEHLHLKRLHRLHTPTAQSRMLGVLANVLLPVPATFAF